MRDTVKDYYGTTLSTSSDLKTNACCTDEAIPSYIKKILATIHDEVMMRYYGCGLVAPELLEGARILDLGAGAGRDCYVLSALVGAQGEIVGVDMTDEQLEVAQRHIHYHQERFGYDQPNVRFLKGYLEHLDELPLTPEYFDIIVSNCVINLAIDKRAVLTHAWNLLKKGGEIYFSDVYCDRRLPAGLREDPVLYGECLSGALYWNDFVNLAKSCGFADPRLVKDSPIEIQDAELGSKLGNARFYSATYRLFKLDDLEPACEDYGQAVIYKGTIPHAEHSFLLDKHHAIQTGKVFPVCGNTWRMLHDTRFRPHFEFIGQFGQHFGIFEGCGTSLPFNTTAQKAVSNGGCC